MQDTHLLGQLEIEAKWQDRWRATSNARQAPPTVQESSGFYCLDMFPYPSLGGLSVNQLRGMLVTDVVARFQETQGRAVLRPMGWDSFGLSIEQEALRRQKTPQQVVDEGVEVMRNQMTRLGLRIDWAHELSTSDPTFYRWTQWLFLRMHERGLAYRDTTRMKWCPRCRMNLANEETQAGHCVHCETAVEERDVRQWMLKITSFAERLHEGLKDLDWPDRVKAMQRNWIGRRVGFKLILKASHEFSGEFEEFSVFVRRLESIPAATFVLLAPEHPLIPTLCDPLYQEEVLAYRDQAARKTERERMASDPTGQPTGAFAINPITLRAMPIWVSDYVLPRLRFGAILGVPESDEKHARFGAEHRIPKIQPPRSAPRRRGERRRSPDPRRHAHPQERGDGLRNPFEEQLVGVSAPEARRRIRKILESRELIEPYVDYHLHDWVFSRQRYWGEPLPILFDPAGEPHPVQDSELPVRVPELDTIPIAEGGLGPLDQVPEFRDARGPDGEFGWRRETDTMPQWFGSCWYYLR
ncbi:MAG: class I tRNA ligase family protein, partial [Planctomycetota bacterium]